MGFSCCHHSGSGYGGFQYVIDGPPPAGHAPTSFSFIVAAPGGGFASVNQLGNNFMTHVIPPNGNQTGFATVTVPDGDPSSLKLLLLGLGGSGVSAIVLKRRALL
jgi:hypothetical protein